MGIPPEDYLKVDGMEYVTVGLMKVHHTDKQMENFHEWFTGQTGTVLSSGTLGIYPYDYERWLEQGMQTAQGADWD